MPPYKRYRRTGRSYKSYARRTTGGANRQKRARAICRAIAQCGRANKYFDHSWGFTAIAPNQGNWITILPAGNAGNPIAPEQGTGINNREGRRIDVHRLSIEGHLTFETIGTFAAVSDGGDYILKWALVRDKQTNQTVPGANQGNQVFTSDTFFANISNFGRYEIVKKKTIRVTPQQNGTTACVLGPTRINFKMTKKFKKPLRVNFDSAMGNPATFTNVVDNSMFICIWLIGPNVPPTTSTMTTHFYSRCVFQDPA